MKVQQAMLATLTGKANLATQFGFNYPIGAALRGLEGTDDVISPSYGYLFYFSNHQADLHIRAP